jgi:hypothetical protein
MLNNLEHISIVPQNSFEFDSFVKDPEAFFLQLAQITGLSNEVCRKVYRLVPESYLVLTVALATKKYLELRAAGIKVAFFLVEDHNRNEKKLNSYELMVKATIRVLEQKGESEIAVYGFDTISSYDGSLLLVDDVMYSGHELSSFIESIFDVGTKIQYVYLQLAAASREALSRFSEEIVEISVGTLIPALDEVIDKESTQILVNYFGIRNCPTVTAYKLPDRMSLTLRARLIGKKVEGTVLYQEQPKRNYPTVEIVAEKAQRLFS